MQSLEELNPILIYLTQPDVHETILRVANERRSLDKSLYPDWIDHVVKYVSNSKFGMENKLHGFEGAVEYFEGRKKIELEAIGHLDIRTIIIENSDYNAEKGITNIIEALVKL